MISNATLDSELHKDFLSTENESHSSKYPSQPRATQIDTEINDVLLSIQAASDALIESNSIFKKHYSHKNTDIDTDKDLTNPSESTIQDNNPPDSDIQVEPPSIDLVEKKYLDKIKILEGVVLQEKLEIDAHKNNVKELEVSLAAMNEKLVSQVNETAEIAYAKELVEAELEELSRKLFEEANNMVSTEKKARAKTEKKNEILERKIKDLQDQLQDERLQSKELKERLLNITEENITNKQQIAILENNSDLNSNDSEEASPNPQIPTPPNSNFDNITDIQTIKEFSDFIYEAHIKRNPKWASTPFMRHSVNEDVEPCLRFGTKPRVTSKLFLDAIISSTLQIEEIPMKQESPTNNQESTYQNMISPRMSNSFSMTAMPVLSGRSALWDRFNGIIPPNPNGCQTCGTEGVCTYRLKLGQKPDEEWSYIDSVCRDRLVAVCEFYGFVHHISNGRFMNRPTSELLSEVMKLKVYMFYARYGLLSHAISFDPSLPSAFIMSGSNNIALPPHLTLATNIQKYESNRTYSDSNYSPTFSLNEDMHNSNPMLNASYVNKLRSNSTRIRSMSASVGKVNHLLTKSQTIPGPMSHKDSNLSLLSEKHHSRHTVTHTNSRSQSPSPSNHFAPMGINNSQLGSAINIKDIHHPETHHQEDITKPKSSLGLDLQSHYGLFR
ncbi:hypothetical protein BB559_002359 [Furculomyces boomerangus]|uniref:GDP/GTP exchange factor Sec2 N-terminal domain-containing protein n=3 Tax=Harpellales TaxID=61421 RepID=A0A2T9YVX2_9FUNG|nr:hypothetical protein BB559_002359 [Furculomyces boomerangus]PWA00485.1 hypothetical protein BB558_003470 [Smittium angustum]